MGLFYGIKNALTVHGC